MDLVCPHCGETEDFYTLEWIAGKAYVTVDPDKHDAEWGGDTDMLWDSSTTVAVFCNACHDQLPEQIEEAFVQRLGTSIHRDLHPIF